jgi:hypothetical protein
MSMVRDGTKCWPISSSALSATVSPTHARMRAGRWQKLATAAAITA